jgi:hypothetical protein
VVQEYVDPYKTVYSPWELPANTAAAADVSTKVEVDPELRLSDERMAQAEAAIQTHQDVVAESVGAVGDDPRLGGGTFQDFQAAQAEARAERAQHRAERAQQGTRTEAKAPGERVEDRGEAREEAHAERSEGKAERAEAKS